MAGPVRFYVPNTAAAVSPAFDTAFWEQTTGAIRLALVTTLTNTSLVNNSQTDSTATANRDVLLYQLVSDGIAPGPISGTFKGQMQAFENNGNYNMRSQVQVWLVSNDGSTTRGVLYAGDLETLTGNPSGEWSNAGVFNRAFPRAGAVSLTSVSAQNNDRIVIEVGYRKHAASSTQGQIRVGDFTTGTDLPEGDTTDFAVTFRPWFEFSEDLFTSRLRGARAYILQ